jgi:hypothetical protein
MPDEVAERLIAHTIRNGLNLEAVIKLHEERKDRT